MERSQKTAVLGLLFTLVLLPPVVAFPFGNQEQLTEEEKKKRQKKKEKLRKRYFDGSFDYETKTIDGKHYFQVTQETDLPEGCEVQLSLYYVRGKPEIDYTVDKTSTEIEKDGILHANLLGLERSLWAGTYKLVMEVVPDKQDQHIKKSFSDAAVTFRKQQTWFYGTKELLEKQKEQAYRSARSDLRSVLKLMEDLTEKLKSARHRIQSVSTGHPTADFIEVALSWHIWSHDWKKRFQAVQKSNERRPRDEKGNTLSFNFVEDRTAYFLQFDLQDLRELYNIAVKRIQKPNTSQKRTQNFRKRMKQLRDSVTGTMVFLNLVVPLPKEDRAVFRKKLKNLTELFQSFNKLLRSSDPPVKSDRWNQKVQSTIKNMISVLFQLNTDLPDLLYERFLSIGKQLNRFSTEFSSMKKKEIVKQGHKMKETFEKTKKMAESFLSSFEK